MIITIIPGYKGYKKHYKYLIEELSKKAKVIFVTIDWSKPLSVLEKTPLETDVLIGHSLGALIAYRISTQKKINKVIICSLSPLLEGDLTRRMQDIVKKNIGNTWLSDLKKSKYGKSKAKDIIALYGEKEIKKIKRLSKKLIKRNICVHNCNHSILKRYAKAIADLI